MTPEQVVAEAIREHANRRNRGEAVTLAPVITQALRDAGLLAE